MLGNLAKIIMITCGVGAVMFAVDWEWSFKDIAFRICVLVAGLWGIVNILRSYEAE